MKEQLRGRHVLEQGGGRGGNYPWREVIKPPRLGLWVSGVKVGEKVVIIEMKKSRGIICHGVCFSRDVVLDVDISVVSLM